MRNNERREFLKALGLSAGAIALPFDAAARARWPSQTITAVVGYKPGGGTDFVSRAITPVMEAALGDNPIRVVNNPGASASLATELVRSKPADGHWWLFASGFNRGLRCLELHPTVPCMDWQFYQADTTVMSISVRTDSPIRDMEDFLRRARDKSRDLRVSHSGKGGSWHLGGTLIKRTAGIEYQGIPYQGGKPAVLACLNGEVDVVTSGLHEHIEHIKAGTLRNLAVTTSEAVDVDGLTLSSVTESLPELKDKTPFGGGTTMGLRRETDPAVLKSIADAWTDSVRSEKFVTLERERFRFPEPVTGEAADRSAALWETIAANLLYDTGLSKISPAELNIPAIEAFDGFWPPKDYKPAF